MRVVEWAPREFNREADRLANGICDSFNLERRILVTVQSLTWNILPDALQAGRDAEQAYSMCSVFQVVLGIRLYWVLFGVLGTLLGFLFTYVLVAVRVVQIWDLLVVFRAERKKTSPLVSAHPSWSLIKSSSVRLAHDFSTQCVLQYNSPSWRVYAILGTTTAKGRTRLLSLCSPTTLSGASWATSTVCICALHFDFGVEQACSAAARGLPPRSPSPGTPFGFSLLFCPFYARGISSCRGAPPRILPVKGSLSLLRLLCVACPRRLSAVGTSYGALGRVFPTAAEEQFGNRFTYVFASAYFFCRLAGFRGGRMCFPGRDLLTQGCS